MRLIDADKVNPSEVFCGMSDFAQDCRNAVIELLSAQPTVDAVPVVRCKDCKYYTKHRRLEGMRCNHPALDYDVECYDQWVNVDPDDFCSYGEREDEV